MNKTLKEDAERIEEIMERTVDRCDIWQDRFIYWIAVAIYHLIQRINRLEMEESKGGKAIDNNSDNTGDNINNDGAGVSHV